MREITTSVNSKRQVLFDRDGFDLACGLLEDVNGILLDIREDVAQAGYATDEETLLGVFFNPDSYLGDRAVSEYKEWAIKAECPPSFLVDIESRARASVSPSLISAIRDKVSSIYDVLPKVRHETELSKDDLTVKDNTFRLSNSFRYKVRKYYETDVPSKVFDYAQKMVDIVSALRTMDRNGVNPYIVLDQILGGKDAPCDGSDLDLTHIIDLMVPKGRQNTSAELAAIGRVLSAARGGRSTIFSA